MQSLIQDDGVMCCMINYPKLGDLEAPNMYYPSVSVNQNFRNSLTRWSDFGALGGCTWIKAWKGKYEDSTRLLESSSKVTH